MVRIAAHENARAGMAASEVFAGDNARFLPNETYRDTLSLFEGRDRIDLYHFGPAHTSGDTIVVFPALATAHVGDLFPRKAAPFIDRPNGGSGVAYPDTLASALAGIADVQRVMPGHAPPPTGSPVRGWTTWDDFREYAAFTRDLLDGARTAFEAGRSVDEAVAGLDLQPRYPDYDLSGAGRAVQAIYDELASDDEEISARRAQRASAGAARGAGVPASDGGSGRSPVRRKAWRSQMRRRVIELTRRADGSCGRHRAAAGGVRHDRGAGARRRAPHRVGRPRSAGHLDDELRHAARSVRRATPAASSSRRRNGPPSTASARGCSARGVRSRAASRTSAVPTTRPSS